MADTYTTNLNLTKPEPGAAEDTWGISLNADLDSLDAIFSSSGTQINLNPNQINFADNKKAIFGTGNDLQIYHDVSNSIIKDAGAGNLELHATNLVFKNAAGTLQYASFISGGAAELRYNGSPKLATTSSGIDVTGTAEVDVLSIGGTAITATATELNYVDGVTGSIQTQLGTKIENSDDVTLGTISSGAITSTGNSQMANLVVTGDLTVQGTTTTVNTDDLNVKDKNITLNYSTGDSSASANGAGITIQDAVSVGNDATILWNTNFDNFDFSHTIRIPDSQKVEFGADADLQIYHESGNNHSVIKETGTGNLKIQAANIEMQIPNGTQNYLQAINGGAVTLYNNGSPKIATTSSGADISGTLTSDGLTVDGVGSLDNNGLNLELSSSNTGIIYDAQNGYHTFKRNGTNALQINGGNGDIAFYDDTGTSQNLKWDASADTLNFVDNAKAQFGTDNDLQIYHSGSNSIIRDVGTGDLRIQGANLQLLSSNGKKYLFGVEDAYTKLYYNNAQKLATTNTGIDVTGTVVSDGLTVDGADVFFNSGWIKSNSSLRIDIDNDNNQTDRAFFISHGNASKDIFKASESGDISFYDDTGTTQGFFWDASSERLGIGTTLPSEQLHVTGASTTKIQISSTSSTGISGVHFGDPDDVNSGRVQYEHSTDHMGIYTNNAERMRIDSSGQLGIGTSSPTSRLTIASGSNSTNTGDGIHFFGTSSNNQAAIQSFNTGAYYGDLRFYTSNHATASTSIGDERLRIARNGDISFYEDTGTTAKLFWDASAERLGLGTTSPSQDLEILNGVSGSGIRLAATSTAYWDIERDSTSGHLTFTDDGAGTVLTVGQDGNVGIGTTSPSTNLTVEGSGANGIELNRNGADASQSARLFFDSSTSGYALMNVAGSLTFNSGSTAGASSGTERMRIDSAGNLLVATTDTTLLNNTSGGGFSVSSNGFTQIAKQGVDNADPVLILNQTGLDGEILRFYKDGGIVGSIGTMNFGDMYLGTDDTGIYFNNGIDSISPINTTNQTIRDNAIDLGASNARFKDLYLAGTANVGAINITGSGTSTFGGAITVQGNIITDSGRVGIGTSSPAYSLDTSTEDNIVARFKSTDASAAILLTDNTSTSKIDNNNGVLSFSADEGDVASGTAITFKTDTAERVRITSAGRMGIGTSSPSEQLDVSGNVLFGSGVGSGDAVINVGRGRTADGNVYIDLHSDTATYTDYGLRLIKQSGANGASSILHRGTGTFTIETDEAAAIRFNTNSVERMRIDSSGLVGIGKTPSYFRLDVQASATGGNVLRGMHGTAEFQLYQANNSHTFLGTANSADLVFITGTTERARIDSSGNLRVGVGNTFEPTIQFTNSGRVASNPAYSFNGDLDTGMFNPGSQGQIAFSNNGSESMRIDSSGNVGIGTSAPNQWASYTDSGATVFQVRDTSQRARVVINGGNGAHLDLVDYAGGANDKHMNMAVDGGVLKFGSLNDAGSAWVKDNIMVMDLGSGNVGIGTDSPSANLHVHATSGDGKIRITGDNITNSGGSIKGFNNGLAFNVAPSGGGSESEVLRINGSQKVGIGTSSPSEKLHVLGNTKITGTITVGASHTIGDVGQTDDFLIRSSEGNNLILQAGVDSDSLIFKTTNTALTINPEGEATFAEDATFAGTISSGAITSTGLNSTSGTVQFADGNASFDSSDANGYPRFTHNGGSAQIGLFRTLGSVGGMYIGGSADGFRVYTANFAQKLLIDQSGNATFAGTISSGAINSSGISLFGKTVADNTTNGIRIDGTNNFVSIVRDGDLPLLLNRKTSDGTLLELRKDNAVGGVIGIQEPEDSANELYIANGTTTGKVGLAFWDYINTARIAPCSGTGAYRDNAIDLGYSGARFDDIYATNGTIQTSDENEKQDIQALTDAEQRVATACKGLIRRFRWKDAVAEKGDDARLHFGVIAQDLQDAFTAEGLDAGDYGMFISQTWEDDDGVEQTRLGVRYNELLAFIITTL